MSTLTKLSDISFHFTEKTLDEIIQKKGGNKHTNYSIKCRVDNKGDSYLSNIYRLTVEGINEKTKENIIVNVFVKAMPKNEARLILFRSSDFFRNEINFYTKVIPAFEKFQNSRNPKQPFNEYVQCLAYHSDGKNDFIAMEDVSYIGFGTATRLKTIDLDYCLCIAKTLGRFHAVSIAFQDLEPMKFKELTGFLEETYYAKENKKWYEPFMKDAITVAVDAVSREYPNSIYEKKTKIFTNENFYERMINFVSAPTKFGVIGNGDCWIPNFLFKYDKQDILSEVKMIDFQLARYASLAIDLTFFLCSCTDGQLRKNNYMKILKTYHSSACDLLKDLGSNPDTVFPFSSLEEELKVFGAFGCGMGIESLPISMLEGDEVTDLDSIQNENAVLTDVWKIGPIKNEYNRRRIADIFKDFIDYGYFENVD